MFDIALDLIPTVHHIKYAHGFGGLCFVWVIPWSIANLTQLPTCFTDTWVTLWLLHACEVDLENMGNVGRYLTIKWCTTRKPCAMYLTVLSVMILLNPKYKVQYATTQKHSLYPYMCVVCVSVCVCVQVWACACPRVCVCFIYSSTV